jgi:hypothetical protein
MTRKRPTCTCLAYRWPHRPGGGLCRWPNPPDATSHTPTGSHAPVGMRPRSAIRRRLIRRYGWHPIRDRKKIRRWLPKAYIAYCRRYGHPYPVWWVGGYIPALRVTAVGPRAPDLPSPGPVPIETRSKYDVWADAFHHDARRRRPRRLAPKK